MAAIVYALVALAFPFAAIAQSPQTDVAASPPPPDAQADVTASAPPPVAPVRRRALRVGGVLVPPTLQLEPDLQRDIQRARTIRHAGVVLMSITAAGTFAAIVGLSVCEASPRANDWFGCLGAGIFVVGIPLFGLPIAGPLLGIGGRRMRSARASLLLLHPELRASPQAIELRLVGRL